MFGQYYTECKIIRDMGDTVIVSYYDYYEEQHYERELDKDSIHMLSGEV
jgi:hypothetical protein